MNGNQPIGKEKILIIGLGNPLAGDDGFGPRVVEYLRTQKLPDDVELVEGGQDAFALMPELESARNVILVDIIYTGSKPGTVYRIPLNQLARQRDRGYPAFSQHEISLLTLYRLPFTSWQLKLPGGILLAVEVGEVELYKEGLSEMMQARIPTVAAEIVKELEKIVQGRKRTREDEIYV